MFLLENKNLGVELYVYTRGIASVGSVISKFSLPDRNGTPDGIPLKRDLNSLNCVDFIENRTRSSMHLTLEYLASKGHPLCSTRHCSQLNMVEKKTGKAAALLGLSL